VAAARAPGYNAKVTRLQRLHARIPRVSTPAVVFGVLLVSLGLSGLSDGEAAEGPLRLRDKSSVVAVNEAQELRVLDWALWNISKRYVDPGRIDPQRMTLAGIEAMELSLPEVLCETNSQEHKVRVRVGTHERDFMIDVQALWAVRTHVREVFQFVSEHAKLDEESRRETEYRIIDEILATLDPHTNLLHADAYASMRDTTKGSFGGLGIEVGMRESGITVLRVLEGNPAYKAGIKAGDRIVQIGDESAVAMSINDAVALMRGEPGTKVRLHVARDGEERPRRFEVMRAVIKIDSVNADILPGPDNSGKAAKVGIARIRRNFGQTTGSELRAALRDFEKAGVSGVILDMRSNPGGLLDAGIDVADAFLSSGTIVSTVGVGSERTENKAEDRGDFPDLPVVVLVDPSSASATEIVAGALRNHDRAIIVGQRTFGKGSVQVLHNRQSGDEEVALKLTIAQYLTPGDISIQSVGVSPDLETRPVSMGKENIAYFSTKRLDALREESLAQHLDHENARSEEITAGPLFFLDDHEEVDDESIDPEDKEADPRRAETYKSAKVRAKILLSDPEIRIARDLVLWSKSTNRQEVLPLLKEFVQEQSRVEDERISKALAKRKIDWSAPPADLVATSPAAASLVVTMKTSRDGNVIPAGEDGVVTVAVTNRSDRPVYRVRTMTKSDGHRFDERELFFGKILPGESKTASFTVNVGESERPRTDRVDLQVFEAFGAKTIAGSALSLDVSTSEKPRPFFLANYQVIDAPERGAGIVGNGDGQLQVGEKVQLRVTVRNEGKGEAPDTRVHLRSAAGEALFLASAREKIGKLEPASEKTVVFPFEVRRLPRHGKAELRIWATDDLRLESTSREIELRVRENAEQWQLAKREVSAGQVLELRAYAAEDAPIVARIAPSTALVQDATHGPWSRVTAGDNRDGAGQLWGFVPTAGLVNKTGQGKNGITEAFSITPPVITLVAEKAQTDGDSVHISGFISDDEQVRDMYITVDNPARNPLGNASKVFYQASPAPGQKKLEFAADVPLRPGNNVIRIVARENDEVLSTDVRWVLRTSGLDEARRQEEALHAKASPNVSSN
jgi:carboxyl-terminal processing protease